MNVIKIIIVISTGMMMLSCNTSKNESKNEINEFIIHEDSIHKKANKDENNLDTYLIIAPSDSTYTGSTEEKYANGIVKYKGFYRFGKRHGEWLYFFPNGNLWSECIYNRGKMHGKSNVYYVNGKLYYSAFYKNNVKDSVWTYYDSTGKELMIEKYKNGQLIERTGK